MTDFLAICQQHSLTDFARRAGVQLKKNGSELSACCPFHAENTPSFTIFRGKDREMYHCFGCGAHGDVVDFVKMFYSKDTKGAIEIISGAVVVQEGSRPDLPEAKESRDSDIARAQDIYRRAIKADGTAVEKYLIGRGIDLQAIGGVPASLRCAPAMEYWRMRREGDPAGRGKYFLVGKYPAMLAPIQGPDAKVTGVHITYIDPETFGKLQLLDGTRKMPAKKVRGVKNGGCIRLGAAGSRIIMAEGIETVLTTKAAAAGTPLDAPAWTCIDLDNFSALRLPPFITDILFAADNDMDAPTPDKPRDTRRALTAAAKRLAAEGRRVRMAWADGGMDFNDMAVA